MNMRSELTAFVSLAATLAGLAQFVFSIFGQASIFVGTVDAPKIGSLVATLLASVVLAYIVVFANFSAQFRPKLLQRARRDVASFAEKCAVPGAQLLDVATYFPATRLLDADEAYDATFALIAKHNGLNPTKALRALANSHKPSIDDRHLVLSTFPKRLDDQVSGWKTDFRAVEVLTELRKSNGIKPNRPIVLSANALLVDWSEGMIGLQVRKQDVKTFPGHLHVIGGVFEPGRDDSLALAAEREVREETKGSAAVSISDCVIILQIETETNFAMVVFLGVLADSKAATSNNWEGTLRLFRFNEIPDILANSRYEWVPTGKQALLAWLHTGCPVGCRNSLMGLLKGKWLLWQYHRRGDVP